MKLSQDLMDNGTCVLCGHSHLPAARQAALHRLLPASCAEIAAAMPCVYSGGKSSAGSGGCIATCTPLVRA